MVEQGQRPQYQAASIQQCPGYKDQRPQTGQSHLLFCGETYGPGGGSGGRRRKTPFQKKADALHEDAIREADRRSNELLPQITLSETEVEFGEVKYLQPISKGITITNVGKSRVRHGLVCKISPSLG